MRFWDTSAVVPLLTLEGATEAAQRVLGDDPEIVVWWATGVECASALARRQREGAAVGEAQRRLDTLMASWLEVDPSDRVRRLAFRALRVHPLRAADALQLAAATAASEDEPATLAFVTLDEHLAQAATREGFPIIQPGLER